MRSWVCYHWLVRVSIIVNGVKCDVFLKSFKFNGANTFVIGCHCLPGESRDKVIILTTSIGEIHSGIILATKKDVFFGLAVTITRFTLGYVQSITGNT